MDDAERFDEIHAMQTGMIIMLIVFGCVVVSCIVGVLWFLGVLKW